MNTNNFIPRGARAGYRPDIDGLRAIAVIAVIWYHAFPHHLPGGFVGVDVFFVLSGYLITGLLLKDQEAGRFSLLRFYANRVRRIFPALVIVLCATVTVGWWLLLPDEFVLLGKHVAASAAFAENFLLWSEASYFDVSTDLKPVMHLWSLAVEEQFYLLFPCALWLAGRRGISVARLAGVALLVSLAWNIVRIVDDPVGSFFSPLSRIWELMAGALLACWQARRSEARQNPVHANALSLAGLAVLLVSTQMLNSMTLYPGWNAIAPVLGAVLVIAAGPHALANRQVLAARPLVWIGLISYPLYLWHWPILTYVRILGVGTRADYLVGAVVASVLLAWLTYAIVERPLRFGRLMRYAPAPLAAALSLVAATGLTMHTAGEAYRAQPLVPLEVYHTHWQGWTRCALVRTTEDAGECFTLDPQVPPRVALIGDSHAVHLATGLRTVLDGTSNAVVLTRAGCFPVLPVRRGEEVDFGCKDDVIQQALDIAIRTRSIHTVVLSGYASFHITGTRLSQMPRSNVDVQARAKALEQALEKTLEELLRANKRVVFFLPVPEMAVHPRICVRTMLWGGTEEVCSVARDLVAQRNQHIHAIAARTKLRFPTVVFVDPTEAICNGSTCFAVRAGKMLYLDLDHLSPSGSRLVMQTIAPQLLPLLKPDSGAVAAHPAGQ